MSLDWVWFWHMAGHCKNSTSVLCSAIMIHHSSSFNVFYGPELHCYALWALCVFAQGQVRMFKCTALNCSLSMFSMCSVFKRRQNYSHFNRRLSKMHLMACLIYCNCCFFCHIKCCRIYWQVWRSQDTLTCRQPTKSRHFYSIIYEILYHSCQAWLVRRC